MHETGPANKQSVLTGMDPKEVEPMIGKVGPMAVSLAVIFILFTAMLNPEVSVGLLLLFLVIMVIYRVSHSH